MKTHGNIIGIMVAAGVLAIASNGDRDALASEQVLDVNMKASARLPLGGAGFKQVSGLPVKLGADGSF